MTLTSALQTIFVERRVPYRVERAWHRAMIAAGFPEIMITAGPFRFVARRETCDVDFVRLVVQGREYFPPEISVAPDATIVDIGGNIGTFAILAASMVPHGRVVSAEPALDNLNLFQRNLQHNDVDNVWVVPVAVAAASGVLKFYTSDQGGYHTIVADRLPQAAVVEVPAVTLEDLFAMAGVTHCHLLKVDCEGAEYEFLPSLPDSVAQRIDQIAMEYHRTADQPARLRAITDRLAAAGFRVLKDEPFPEGGGHMFLRRTSA